jgi:hypothetical protein
LIREAAASSSAIKKKNKYHVKYIYIAVVNLTFIFLSFLNHVVNLFLEETTLVVSDGDAVGLSGSLVRSRGIQDTISINVKGNFNLRNTTRNWWNIPDISSLPSKLLSTSLVRAHSETSLTMRGIQVKPPTKTISWTFNLLILDLESWRTFSTGSRVPWNRS